jgi:excisionase family DNA binding protein
LEFSSGDLAFFALRRPHCCPFFIFLPPAKNGCQRRQMNLDFFLGVKNGRKMEDKAERKTLTVPEVAKLLGIGRNQAYEAAKRGEIPTIRIGKRILVPLVALEQKLRGER